MASKFTHLHCHTHYSLLQALPHMKPLVKQAKEFGMQSLAITDYGAMYGAVEFTETCKKQEIRPVIGQCAYMAIDRLTDKRPRIDNRQNQLVLLAENNEGYKNLLKMTTIAYTEGFYYKPRMDKELLRKHGKGIIALSGGLRGDINRALAMDEYEKAKELALEYADIFGKDNFFLELQDHPELDEWKARNADLKRLSAETGIPLVGTKDVHYLKPTDAEAHDVLLCIGEGKLLDQENRIRMTDADYSFVSGEHMEKAFKDCPEAIENTWKIAERCDAEIELGKWYFADYKIPDGKNYDEVLRENVYKGIAEKVPEITEEIKTRLEYELEVISTKGYSPYFLVVADYMSWCRSQGIVTTTRGSAAGSLASYAIDIVPVNPLTYKLPFERFLNPFRPSPPDVDSDIEDSRRDEVIAYVTEKYGKDKVAQIGTFGTLQARGATRDVGRVLDYPYAFCDRVSKLIPMGSQGFAMTIQRALDETPELNSLYKTDPQVKRLLNLAQQVEGCARHVSVHAAGVVIAPRPLTEFTALQKETGGEKLITQYEMKAIENAGVLKMDFLGLKNLSILGRAIETIKRTKGVDIDVYKLPLDDEKTYKMLGEGDTTGVFQLSGSGMTKWLKELRPEKITDIMAIVALYRPGPMESIPEYIRRKRDPSLVTYDDPRMESYLKESYGILTYQEDVMLTAIHLAGYDWLEADQLRKAIGKKIPAEMAKHKPKFVNGCVKGGMTKRKAEYLWSLFEPFAAYGFNKAHAASYGMVAYQTAYLKANYLCEFMTAVLTADSSDADRIAVAVNECGHLGIDVLPPDVNESLHQFTYMDDKTIRFGMSAIKNVGVDVIQAIIDERESGGKFESISDMSGRVASKSFNKRALESLIKSGAMDSLGERNQLLGSINEILAFHKKAARDRDTGQDSLFAAIPTLQVKGQVALREVPPATKREKLAWERELLGLYVSEHPFKEYKAFFGDTLLSVADLPKHKDATGLVRFGGIIMESRQILTKKGDPMAFVRIEDTSGSTEVVAFPTVFREGASVWEKDTPVMVEGKLQERDGELNVLAEKGLVMTADTIKDMRDRLMYAGRSEGREAKPGTANIASLKAEYLHVAVPATMPKSFADEMKRIFEASPGTRRVYLLVDNGAGEPKKISTSYSVSVSADLIRSIESVVGKGAVRA